MLREAEDDIRPEPRGCQINQGADKSRDVFIQSDTADGIFTQGSSTRHSRDVMLSCRVVARGLERTRDARRTRIDLTPTRACARSSARRCLTYSKQRCSIFTLAVFFVSLWPSVCLGKASWRSVFAHFLNWLTVLIVWVLSLRCMLVGNSFKDFCITLYL